MININVIDIFNILAVSVSCYPKHIVHFRQWLILHVIVALPEYMD